MKISAMLYVSAFIRMLFYNTWKKDLILTY